MSKLYIIENLKQLHKVNKLNPLSYMTNGSKNKETKFCRIFTPWSGSLAVGQNKHQYNSFYYVVLIRLTLFFQAQFRLTSCIMVLRQIFFSVSQGNRKRHFLIFHGNGCKEDKHASSIARTLQIPTTTEKIGLTYWVSTK